MLPKYIGITGKAQHGKDTCADWLVSNYDYHKIAFATELKRISYELGLLPKEGMLNFFDKSQINPHCNKTYRAVLQEVGVKMREVYSDVWVDKLFYESNRLSFAGLYYKRIFHFVIPDVRFFNEAQAIKETDGKLIRVIRTDYEGLSREEAAHSSETEMDSFPEKDLDLIIQAESGNLKKIYSELDTWMKEFSNGS